MRIASSITVKVSRSLATGITSATKEGDSEKINLLQVSMLVPFCSSILTLKCPPFFRLNLFYVPLGTSG